MPENNFYLSTKNDEKVSTVELSASSKVKASLSNQESMPKESKVDGADYNKGLSSNPKDERVEISRAVQTHESLASVSWRMPHKKHGEPQPGFNLDYSPPKTHPPVHN
ncbi:root meristem growth factor 10 [Cornus florida]|uniref:root meristem growth factor 10 n=1 Tax=Cornus florida TaxID=4283 RepID=UPI0028966627|nr:root meristem growth factor 10 [Cornus florida]